MVCLTHRSRNVAMAANMTHDTSHEPPHQQTRSEISSPDRPEGDRASHEKRATTDTPRF